MPNKTESLQKVKLPNNDKIKVVEIRKPYKAGVEPIRFEVDFVVSQSEFKIPKEVISKVTRTDYGYCSVEYNSESPISVFYGSLKQCVSIKPIFVGYGAMGFHKLSEEKKFAEKLRPFKSDSTKIFDNNGISNLIWRFDSPDSTVPLNIQLTFKTDTKVKNTDTGGIFSSLFGGTNTTQVRNVYSRQVDFKVSHNDAPIMIGGSIAKDFKSIEATDKNIKDGDDIPAFQVRLTNEKLVGKIGVNISGTTYPIPEDGLYYSQGDRLFGNMKLVSLDSAKQLPRSIGVIVKPCDNYTWGQEKGYKILSQ